MPWARARPGPRVRASLGGPIRAREKGKGFALIAISLDTLPPSAPSPNWAKVGGRRACLTANAGSVVSMAIQVSGVLSGHMSPHQGHSRASMKHRLMVRKPVPMKTAVPMKGKRGVTVVV